MEYLLNIIANAGAPIAVSLFLLVRVESKVTCLTESPPRRSRSQMFRAGSRDEYHEGDGKD